MITWTRCPSVELDGATRTAMHELWHAAFGGGFSAEDADHAFGGVHVVARDGERLAAHASVVPRSLRIGDREIDAGYVEAVATAPSDQGRGLGTHALRLLDEVIRADHAMGALSTASPGFYAPLGWERWEGPSAVLRRDGTLEPTPDDDGGLMVLRFATTADVALTAPISCQERPGDVW